VQRFHHRLACQLARAIDCDLAGDHSEPTGEIVAAELTKSSQIVFEYQEPEVAERVVDFVIA
jgi:hypothetical protein